MLRTNGMPACLYVHMCMYIFVRVCVCVCPCTYAFYHVYICMYIYIYVYIHAGSDLRTARWLDVPECVLSWLFQAWENRCIGDIQQDEQGSFVERSKILFAGAQGTYSGHATSAQLQEQRQTDTFWRPKRLGHFRSNHLTIQRADATDCCLNGFQEHHSEPKTRDTPYCLRPSIYLSICGSIHHIYCYLSTFIFVQSSPALPLVLVFVLLCFLCSLKVGSEGSHGLTGYMHKQMEREPNWNEHMHDHTFTHIYVPECIAGTTWNSDVRTHTHAHARVQTETLTNVRTHTRTQNTHRNENTHTHTHIHTPAHVHTHSQAHTGTHAIGIP